MRVFNSLRRQLVLATCLSAMSFGVLAQNNVIRIVVGYPAGATSDTLTRVVAEAMSQRLGQPVIVENRTGAGGQLANLAVKAAAPDGLTLMMTPVATMSIFPHSYAGQLKYDPFTDFAPVAHLSDFQIGLGVGTHVPAQNLEEYVKWVKADPQKNGFYGSAAPGSLPHFFGVMFGKAAGLPLTHVPYRGTAAAMAAIAGGEIAALSTVAADLRSLVQAGVRACWPWRVSSAARTSRMCRPSVRKASIWLPHRGTPCLRLPARRPMCCSVCPRPRSIRSMIRR
jgi:tripartite-type tricarboxylate transporter receptor subunit TctC